MRPSFSPRQVSENPFGDPALFVPFSLERRALLFDCGRLDALFPRDVLKVSHVFVSHAHMDHFMGFDRLIHLALGREKDLFLYGPEGFIENVRGKLSGYLWNLVHRFENRFTVTACEVSEKGLLRRCFALSDAFRPGPVEPAGQFSGLLLSEPAFSVSAAILDHGAPSLAFALRERFHVNIKAAALQSLGLAPGPWLARFKAALFEDRDPLFPFEIGPDEGGPRSLPLGELARRIARISPGQSLAYVTDAVFSPENERKILALARDVDHLYIEAAFLDSDRHQAREKLHLTAAQAGRLARKAKARDLTVFHFSPRYSDAPHLLHQEALRAFRGETEDG